MSTVALIDNFRRNFAVSLSAREDLTISEVARRTGTSRAYIHRVLDGAVCPTLDTCERLAKAIDRPLGDLIESPRVFNRA